MTKHYLFASVGDFDKVIVTGAEGKAHARKVAVDQWCIVSNQGIEVGYDGEQFHSLRSGEVIPVDGYTILEAYDVE